MDRPGWRDDIFPVAVAGEVVGVLEQANFLVLGGEFWVREEDGFHPVYATWHYDDGDLAESIEAARRTLQEPWVEPSWFVSFVWEPPDLTIRSPGGGRTQV